MWIGDRLRVGISNTNKEILKWTRGFLKGGLKQPKEIILGEIQYTPKIPKQKIVEAESFLRSLEVGKIRKRVDKRKRRGKVLKKKETLAYAILLSNNYILFHILSFLERKLWGLVKLMHKEARFALYAGLIGAEGHVDKTRVSVDISQSNKGFLKKLCKFMRIDRFNVKYNGKLARIQFRRNKENQVAKKIGKYLKHDLKIRELKEMLDGNYVKDSYVVIVEWIRRNPGRAPSEIASMFGQNECFFSYQKLTQLVKQRLVKRYKTKKKGKFRYETTKEGEEWVKSNKCLLENTLSNVRKHGSDRHGMYRSKTLAMMGLLK